MERSEEPEVEIEDVPRSWRLPLGIVAGLVIFAALAAWVGYGIAPEVEVERLERRVAAELPGWRAAVSGFERCLFPGAESPPTQRWAEVLLLHQLVEADFHREATARCLGPLQEATAQIEGLAVGEHDEAIGRPEVLEAALGLAGAVAQLEAVAAGEMTEAAREARAGEMCNLLVSMRASIRRMGDLLGEQEPRPEPASCEPRPPEIERVGSRGEQESWPPLYGVRQVGTEVQALFRDRGGGGKLTSATAAAGWEVVNLPGELELTARWSWRGDDLWAVAREEPEGEMVVRRRAETGTWVAGPQLPEGLEVHHLQALEGGGAQLVVWERSRERLLVFRDQGLGQPFGPDVLADEPRVLLEPAAGGGGRGQVVERHDGGLVALTVVEEESRQLALQASALPPGAVTPTVRRTPLEPVGVHPAFVDEVLTCAVGAVHWAMVEGRWILVSEDDAATWTLAGHREEGALEGARLGCGEGWMMAVGMSDEGLQSWACQGSRCGAPRMVGQGLDVEGGWDVSSGGEAPLVAAVLGGVAGTWLVVLGPREPPVGALVPRAVFKTQRSANGTIPAWRIEGKLLLMERPDEETRR